MTTRLSLKRDLGTRADVSALSRARILGFGAFALMRIHLVVLVVVAASVLLSARRHAQAEQYESGLPPAGCWTMEGGSPARSGASRLPGIRDGVLEAWSQTIGEDGASIDEEPRVWDYRIYVSVRSPKHMSLHVLGLSNGKPLADPVTVESNLKLEPSVWNDIVLIRTGSRSLGAFRLAEGTLEEIWSVETDGDVFSPMLIDGDVFALVGTDIVCWSVRDEKQPRWRAKGDYRGPLACRGYTVLAKVIDDQGNLYAVPLYRDHPLERKRLFLRTLSSADRGQLGNMGTLAIHDKQVFAHFPVPFRSKEDNSARHVMWLRRLDEFGELQKLGWIDHMKLPVEVGTSWITRDRDKRNRVQLIFCELAEGKTDVYTSFSLSQGKYHRSYATTPRPCTAVEGCVYSGERAFDPVTHKILWNTGKDARFRLVPGHNTLLSVRGLRQLVALRSKGTAGAPLFVGPSSVIGTKDATEPVRTRGIVYFDDDSWHEGDYEISLNGATLTTVTERKKREKRKPFDVGRVLFALDENHALVYVASPMEIERLLGRYHFYRHQKAYVKFARDAFRTGDPKLMGKFLRGAENRGATRKELKFPYKQQQALIKRPRKISAKKVKALNDAEAALRKQDAAITDAAMVSTIDDPRWPIRKMYLRRLLKRDKPPAKAVAMVRERVPAFLMPKGEFNALEWLDLVDQFQHTTIQQLKPPEGESSDLTRVEREFGSARLTWRKDLVALEANQLLIMSPLAKPERIAGCLSLGTLVCDALEQVFESGKAVRTDPWPLMLRLYENKDEYMHAWLQPNTPSSYKKRMEDSAGHFDPSAGISRIYFPPDRRGWASVMDTYAHELTHHWIAERCPLFRDQDRGRVSGGAGYWIVEGIAEFIESFRWDLENRSWDPRNPYSFPLDIVGSIDPEHLYNWDTFFAISSTSFWKLDSEKTRCHVPMRWRMGREYPLDDTLLFYCQAGATCHYLYQASPELRTAMLNYVRDHYTGKHKPGKHDIERVFGMSAAELGKRVVDYARSALKPGAK